MFKKYLFLFTFLAITPCFSQGQDFIFGQLVDSVQNEPIPFATIRIKDKALGVISNVDGTFKIPVRFKTLGELIEISCLGYKSKELLIEDLSKERSNVILMKPGGFELSEAVVSAKIKRLRARQIVKIAVNSIPQNYPYKEFGLVGYYRDYQVKNRNYTNLSEAIINVHDSGFDKKNILTNRYQLYSYNQNLDFEIDEFAKQPYDYDGLNKVVPGAKMKNDGGNEFIMLRMHDAIRNYGLESFSFIDDMSSDFIDNHRFRLIRKINYKKEKVYEIDFIHNDDTYRAKGKIFINTDDFAIHKLDYAVFKRKKPGEISLAINAEERFSDGFNKMNDEMLYHIQMEYARGTENKMLLNYISFYNKILVQRPAKFKSKFVINLEDKSFKIRLNKLPAAVDKIKNRDFKIRYGNEPVPIKEFWLQEDERTFVVCPHIGYKRAERIFKGIFTERKNLKVSDLKYAYGEIRDSEGNKLDERKWEYIHQYREFFVQETQSNPKIVNEGGLMLKSRPLDSPEQPISNEIMKDVYWKNTPLKGRSN